jgi:hypothetical protein
MGAFQGSQYIQEGFCENPEKADKISSKPDSMIIFKAVLLITQAVYQMQIIQDEINKKIYIILFVIIRVNYKKEGMSVQNQHPRESTSSI